MKKTGLKHTALLLISLLTLSCSPVGKNAKYVFYFIGDGMGFSHVALAEAYQATHKGVIGSEPLCFTRFPVMGMATTYSASHYITCSSAAGTALACGVKTRNGMLSVLPDSTAAEPITYKMHRSGIPIGIMTTVTVDHATPAVFYAHAANRKQYYDIASQLPETGFEFFAGGGFEGVKDPRHCKENLFDKARAKGYAIAQGLQDYAAKAPGADKMILFRENPQENRTLARAADRTEADMKLADLVECAIAFLNKEDKGFFMMAEGAQIDWESHSNDLVGTIMETLDFDLAVKVACRFYEQHPDETLIVVTADHETGGVSLGYEKGYVYDLSYVDRALSVSTAPDNAKNVDNYMGGVSADSLSRMAGIGWTTRSHTGGAVPVFAIGAGSGLFAGRQDNTDLPKKLCRAMGVAYE